MTRIECQLRQIEQHLGLALTISRGCRVGCPPVPQRVGERATAGGDRHPTVLGDADQLRVLHATGHACGSLEVTSRRWQIAAHLCQYTEADRRTRDQLGLAGRPSELRDTLV